MGREGRRSGRVPAILLALTAGALAGGCDLLYGASLGDPDDFEAPEPVATYTEGGATLAIGDETPLALDRVSNAGLYDDWFGGEATFSNGDGWYVRVSGVSSGGILGTGGTVTLDRIAGGEHWTTWDASRCIVDIEAVDPEGMRGSATCKGLRWSDAVGGFAVSLEPAYIDGQEPFDAEITFEALPQSSTPA